MCPDSPTHYEWLMTFSHPLSSVSHLVLGDEVGENIEKGEEGTVYGKYGMALDLIFDRVTRRFSNIRLTLLNILLT